MGSPVTELDNPLRVGLGWLNGAFFLTFLKHRREHLFLFLVALAFLHATVANFTIIYQVLEAQSFTAGRFGGVTNPIPFSEMLMASIGIVVIYLCSNSRDKHNALTNLFFVLFLCAGLFALIMTGTRGTFLAIPALVLLVAANARFQQLYIASATLVFVGLAIYLYGPLWNQFLLLLADVRELASDKVHWDVLSNSIGQRAKMWITAIDLAFARPVFGYGLGSYPGVLYDPSIGITPDTSIIHNQLHNEYIDLVFETGLLGLILFSLLLGTAFVTGLRLYANSSCRDRACALMWISSCYGLFGLSQAFFSHSNTSLQFGVYLGILMWTVPAQHNRN
jgi:O-antigen ligase